MVYIVVFSFLFIHHLYILNLCSNKINVKEAMEYVAQSWNSVKAETIINCWRKTGILPTVNDNVMQQNLEMEGQKDQEGVELFLQQLLSIGTLLDKSLGEINQYLELIDLTIPTEQSLADAEIVRLILDEECEKIELNDDESDKERSVMSTQEGLNSLKTWLQYFEEQKSEKFDMKDIRIFRKYMGIMQRKLFESKTQKNITSFFESTNM
jgi:hypothetical protein